MKIPGLIEINTDLSHNDIKECKVLNLTFTDPHAPGLISELGLIREIKYFKALFKTIIEDLEINDSENVVIVSPSINDLIFNLSIICAIYNNNIEYVNQGMYYTGRLRKNIHISDEDLKLELNLEDYDLDEFEDF